MFCKYAEAQAAFKDFPIYLKTKKKKKMLIFVVVF